MQLAHLPQRVQPVSGACPRPLAPVPDPLQPAPRRASAPLVPVSAWLLYATPLLSLLCYRGANRGRADFARIDAMALVQIAFFALAALWLLSRLRDIAPRLPELLYARPVIYLVGYLVLAVSSVLWSAQPALTLYRSFEACVCLGLILDAVLCAKDLRHSLTMLIGYCLAEVLGALALKVRIGRLGADGSIVDVLHGNVLPAVAAVGMFLCMGLGGRRILRLGMWGFLVTVIMTTSAGTYVAVLLTVLVAAPFRASTRVRAAVFMILGAVVVASLALGSFSFLTETVMFGKGPEAIRTGTGRVGMWEYYWEKTVRDNVWLGHGYVAGEHQQNDSGVYYCNGHNAFVAAFTNLGAAGAAIFVLLTVSAIRRAARLRRGPGAVLLPATVCIWINSLTIPSLTSRVFPSWIVAAWLCVLIGAARASCRASAAATLAAFPARPVMGGQQA